MNELQKHFDQNYVHKAFLKLIQSQCNQKLLKDQLEEHLPYHLLSVIVIKDILT